MASASADLLMMLFFREKRLLERHLVLWRQNKILYLKMVAEWHCQQISSALPEATFCQQRRVFWMISTQAIQRSSWTDMTSYSYLDSARGWTENPDYLTI